MHSTCLPSAEIAQPLADRAGGVAADPGVDLVEHERRLRHGGDRGFLRCRTGAAARRRGTTRHRGEREHHARELAAGSDLAQRAGRHAGVRRDQELDRVAARRARLARGERDREGGVRHRQRGELLAHRQLEARRVPLARLAQRGDVARERRLRLVQPRRGLGERDLGAVQLVAPRPRGGGVVEHRGERPAVLAHEPLDARQALFDRVERALLAGDPLAVAVQLGGEILRLDRERAQPLGERVEVRVDAGERVQAGGGGGDQLGAAEAGRGVFGRERVGGRAGGEAQRVEAAEAGARGQQLVVLVLVEAGGVDLRELVLEQVELALARCGELAQRVELRGEAPGLRERLRAGAQTQRVVGAADLRRGSPAGRRRASACDARAGRRRRPAASRARAAPRRSRSGR